MRLPVVDCRADYRCTECAKPGVYWFTVDSASLTVEKLDRDFERYEGGTVVGEYSGWPVEVTYFDSEGRATAIE